MKQRIIIVLICIILIIVIIRLFAKPENDNGEIINSIESNITYTEMIDEYTNEKYYQIYDNASNRVIANVTDESMIQIYLDNPDYSGTDELYSFEEEQNVIEE